jgi:hypothetical protein
MAAACTGVGVENRAAVSRSFNEGDIDSSEKLCILLSCWPVLPGAPQIRGLPRQSQLPVFFLITLKTNGGNEGRIFSDQFAEPEGPHITTDALSA